jgi:transposase
VAFLAIQKLNYGLYLLGGSSTRQAKGPRNTKKSLAKIDISTNELKINDYYKIWTSENSFNDNDVLNFLERKGYQNFKINTINVNKLDESSINDIQIDCIPYNIINTSDKIYSIDDIKDSTNKSIGLSHFLNFISDSIGLTPILKSIFPDNWVQLLILSHYQIVSSIPNLYCHYWVETNDYSINPSRFSSQRISDLHKQISISDINKFYLAWANHIKENEFLACDISSISTYSKNLSNAAYGYNRDKEKLKQINICLLFGETSGLPVYSTIYHGSMHDVKTFVSTAKQFQLLRENNFKLVMDKGFYSKKNIDYMTQKKSSIPFIISTPLTVDFMKDYVDNNRDLENQTSYYIHKDDNNIFYRSLRLPWSKNIKLHAHLYLNREKKIAEDGNILAKVNEMYDMAILEPLSYIDDEIFRKYLLFRRSFKSDTGYNVKIKNNILDPKDYEGWTLLISNEVKDPIEAFYIYRNRNIVEEAFNKIKNSLDSKRIKVHSDITCQSKLFINFLSLIIMSKIHNIMKKNHLYDHYTLLELLLEVNKQQVVEINNNRVIRPAHARQVEIYKHFKCPLI